MKITIIATGGASVALDNYRRFKKDFLGVLRVAISDYTLIPETYIEVEEEGYTIRVEELTGRELFDAEM